MALNKSDKIIAIFGVIILIIAAIGIFLYPTKEEVKKVAPEEKTFYVTWKEETGKPTVIKGDVGKKQTYTKPIDVTAPAKDVVSVLTHVEIQLTWKDDVTYIGILGNGKDTLTANIYPTGGKPGTAKETKGSGNSSFSFDINSVPALDQVTANDIDEANNIIKENFSDKDKASFDTKITVKTGEKIWRLLKFLKDKGNDFELKIIYKYSYPVIMGEPEEDGSEYEEPPEETAHQAYMITNLVHF